MAVILKDRVKVVATTTGTGTFTLGSAATGFQSFAVIGDGNETYYTIAMQPGGVDGDFEVGIGTVTDTAGTFTLSRDTVLESSNAGSKVDFPAGTKDVFVTYPAERAVFENAAGTAVTALDVTTLGATTANITTANITAGTVTTSPASGNDLVNKSYVDTLVAAGIHFHDPVRVESPINLNATYNNGTSGVGATLTNAGTQVALVIDGITMVVADRVLVYEQTDQTQNGVYVVTSIGSGATNWVLTRSTDADTYGFAGPDTLSEGSTFFVQEGATGAGETYTCNTVGTITFGTTNITFAQISSAQIYSAGTGLTLSGTQFRITNTGTAGTYGSASQVPVFTTNAQGQVTSVTNTAIGITSAAVSGLAASATTDTTNAANITSGTLPAARLSGSYTGITGVGTLAAGTWSASTILANRGGTGFASYAVGDLLYADTTTTLAKLPDVAVGNALISGGVGAAPSYGKIGLSTHVSGTLPVANGGTGQTTYTNGQLLIGNTTGGTLAKATLTEGTGITVTNGAGAITIAAVNNGTVTSVGGTGTVQGLTLSGTVTSSGNLTLGGSLSAVSLTTQVSGTLPVANGGTGITSLGAGIATFLGTPSSANLAAAVTNETGSGALVFATSPTLVTPALGTPASGVVTNLTGTASININGTVGATTANTGAFTTLSATGVTTVQAGTVSAPAITTTGDTNTGIYFPSADTVAITTGGTQAMTINANGDMDVIGRLRSSGNQSVPAWTTTGVTFDAAAGTFTDNSTAAAGVVATRAVSSFNTPTLASTNAITVTNAATVYIANGPTAGTNTTITNGYALWVDAGNAQFDGDATVNGTLNVRTAIDLADSDILRFGSGDDWELYHNGTSNIMDLTNGDLLIRDDGTAGDPTRFTFGRTTGNLTATTFTGALSGNATTATTLETARTINGVSFNGSANITITAAATNVNTQLASLGVGTAASGTAGQIRATGDIVAHYSDDRLKTKLGNIEDALAKVRTLSGFYYIPNETAQDLGYQPDRDVGVSAQQVQAVQPEATAPAPIDEKYLTVRYERLVPLLIEAIKELDSELQSLKAKLKD